MSYVIASSHELKGVVACIVELNRQSLTSFFSSKIGTFFNKASHLKPLTFGEITHTENVIL